MTSYPYGKGSVEPVQDLVVLSASAISVSANAPTTLVALSAHVDSFNAINNGDKDLVITYKNYKIMYLEAGAARSYDAGANNKRFEQGESIKAYLYGGASASSGTVIIDFVQ